MPEDMRADFMALRNALTKEPPSYTLRRVGQEEARELAEKILSMYAKLRLRRWGNNRVADRIWLSATSDLLNRLAPMVLGGYFESFWSTLRTEAVQTDPPYSYSGSVALMLIALLADRGWTPVIDTSSPEATSLADADIGTVMCCQEKDAKEGLSFLHSLTLSNAELAIFQKEFSGEEWDKAVPALREAIAYLEKTLALLPEHGDWVLLFIG